LIDGARHMLMKGPVSREHWGSTRSPNPWDALAPTLLELIEQLAGAELVTG
jgi:hypothetical protein